MRTYVSCGCIQCRNSPSQIKTQDKKQAHRLLRRTTKRALKNLDEDNETVIPQSISTGYKS